LTYSTWLKCNVNTETGQKFIFLQYLQSKNIIFFSIMSQAIFIWMPGRQPLQFYLCSNQIRDTEHLPFKQNWISISLLILSFILYIVASLKIKWFSSKQKHSVVPLTHHQQSQCINISFVESRSLSDYVTNICTILGTSAFLGTLLGINRSNPITFTQVNWYLNNIIHVFKLEFCHFIFQLGIQF